MVGRASSAAHGRHRRSRRIGRRLGRPGLKVVAASVVLAVLFGVGAPALPQVPAPVRTAPNIVLLLTDDQRFDQLQHMATVASQLTAKGISFSNAVVSNPLCCPARATFLTGTYSGTNGVWANAAKLHGGFSHFNDHTTIATVLHKQGYRTALMGKYLNGYGPSGHYVPPGWDRWFALTSEKYFGTAISDQGKVITEPHHTYQTDVLGEQAVRFIDSTPADKPLFLYWAPHAPHQPAFPAPRDVGALAGQIPHWRPPSYNEADVSDKPGYIRRIPSWRKHRMKAVDALDEKMYESLLDVDRWIKSILSALARTGRLSNTLIVFASDNGFLLGEHRFLGKMVPYEEAFRIPLIVRWDAAGWKPRTDPHMVANVDIAETFAEAAGTTMPGNEGLSLLPLLRDPSTPWRHKILTEHVGGPTRPTYCGVRTERFAYAQYMTGEEELYDLRADPYELTNLVTNPASSGVLHRMRRADHRLCNPLPPGFHWSH